MQQGMERKREGRGKEGGEGKEERVGGREGEGSRETEKTDCKSLWSGLTSRHPLCEIAHRSVGLPHLGYGIHPTQYLHEEQGGMEWRL